jgi:hypothetical protein
LPYILYGKVCWRHHDLLNYQTDLFKTEVFRKCMIRHWWQTPLFSLIPSQKLIFNKKKLTLKFNNAAQADTKGSLTFFMYFPWPPLKVGLSISTFFSLFNHGRKLLFLIYTFLLFRWSPKYIIQLQALLTTIFETY